MLVLISIASVQTGAAAARTVFDDTGALGITLMRLGLSCTVLVAVLRPRPWTWSRDAQVATLLFGLAMAGMNIVFYLALRTVPLGVCVTVEFLGPLTIALVQTRRWLDAFWVGVAATGVALLGLDSGGNVPIGGCCSRWSPARSGVCTSSRALASAVRCRAPRDWRSRWSSRQ